MLARIAHELYWVGRSLSRAEHTARLLDGVFHADLQGRATDAGSTRLSWEALLSIMGADPERGDPSPPARDDVISLLTLDPDDPASVLFCVSSAREGARRVRDVFSAEMWEAINTFHLGLLRRDMSAALRSGPYSLYAYVRERCALFWGVTDRTMLRDEARAFLEAGAAIEAGDMVLRMLRVALPTDEAEPTEADPRDGQAVALLQAMGGFQAFRRAIPAPPKASLVGSFLLYQRAYPDSVAHSVSALHAALTAADSSYRSSAPVLRLSRLMADLDFRSRSVEGAGPLAQTLGPVQRELELVDGDIALRYFGGRIRARRQTRHRLMHFAIRYLTEYRYDGPVTDNLNALRVTPATTAIQRVDDFGVRVEPQARLHQHLDYYGTTVIEFGIAKAHESLAIDVRARVATAKPPEPPAGTWPALEGEAYRGRAIEFLLPYAGEPDDLRVDELVGLVRADTPLGTLERVVQVIPDRFEYRAGVTYVGSTVEDLLDAGAGVCQDFAHLALVLLRRNGIAARYVSGYLFAPPEGVEEDADSAEVDTHAWLEALVPRDDAAGEPQWVGIDPTNRCLAGENYVKIGHGRHYRDVPPIKGVFRGTASAKLEASVRMHRTDAAGAKA